MSTLTTVTLNDEYSKMIPHVTQIRDCVRGSPFIKGKGYRYLPHPSQIDTTSAEQQQRYDQFIASAEYDEFTGYTKKVVLGKMKFDDLTFTPPDKLGYLNEDVDGDGLSIKGLAESCAGNVMEVKWHLMLCDYKGLSDLPIGVVSAQDIADANPRATIKQYPRESVLDWDFERINGKMQLTYLVLRECGEVVNHDTGSKEDVTSYLKLGLDEIGYYQQKKADGMTGSSAGWGEKSYVSVKKSVLQFIPVSIACDEEYKAGHMPMELGFLSPIGELSLYRYRVSAKYKEALDSFVPTLHVTGVTKTDFEQFQAINGRDYVASGSKTPNIWPSEEVTVNLLEASGSLEQFTTYFEDNKNKVRALGGVFKTDQSAQRTATEVIIEADNNTSLLTPIANSVESAVKWQIAYCAMFEDVISPENVEQYISDIKFAMAKDFGVSKLTVEEIKALIELQMSGLLPKDEVIKLLEMGGWTISKYDDLVNALAEGIL